MNRQIIFSFANGLGNFIQVTPVIQTLLQMGDSVDISLNMDESDPRKKELTNIIDNYEGVGFYDNSKEYDHKFVIWGEFPRNLPCDGFVSQNFKAIPQIWQTTHEVEFNFGIARHLGYKGAIPSMHCPVSKNSIVDDELFRNNNDTSKKIFIHIGSRPENFWKKKRWLNSYWYKLLELLNDNKHFKFNVYLSISKWEKEDIENIFDSEREDGLDDSDLTLFTESMETPPYTKVLAVAVHNFSFTETTYLISKCDLIISTDSGPMHVAAALNKPVIQLFGPTLPVKNKAWYGEGLEDKGVVLKSDLDCSPCLYTNRFMECQDNVCMQKISSDMVVKEVVKIFDKNKL